MSLHELFGVLIKKAEGLDRRIPVFIFLDTNIDAKKPSDEGEVFSPDAAPLAPPELGGPITKEDYELLLFCELGGFVGSGMMPDPITDTDILDRLSRACDPSELAARLLASNDKRVCKAIDQILEINWHSKFPRRDDDLTKTNGVTSTKNPGFATSRPRTKNTSRSEVRRKK